MPVTIDKPSKYFNTLTWTGDGTNNKSVTGVGFRPEFAWTKRRDSAQGNTNHNIWDFVRGAGNNAELNSNGTGAEGASGASEYGYISALNSDGFTLTDGTDATYKNLYTNNNGGTYVSWNWLANGTGVSNTSGTITSTVSANTTSGFSIVSYTGNATISTVGHGLGVAPKMLITKNRDQGSGGWNWKVYHASLGNTKDLTLNATTQALSPSDYGQSVSPFWNNTTPTSTVFTIGADGVINASGNKFIAYCFAEVKGFSKAGSYTGNGSSDGTFVYTGFKPAFVMFKQTNSANDWIIEDNKRSTYNEIDARLFPNSSSAELSNGNGKVDYLSNGFKLRHTNSNMNGSGDTYIYMAFSENPFTSSKGIPCTAR